MRVDRKKEEEKQNKIDSQQLSIHKDINKLSQHHKKIKYCPLVNKILFKKNRNLSKPIIYSIAEFLNFYEKIKFRVLGKKWNEVIKQKLPFLTQENFINCVVLNGKNVSKRKESNNYSINDKTKDNSTLSKELNNINTEVSNLFENSNKKFSKKKVLIKLISSKNFNTIKNKVSLVQMTKSRILSYEEI
jgi:hypothetical protein